MKITIILFAVFSTSFVDVYGHGSTVVDEIITIDNEQISDAIIVFPKLNKGVISDKNDAYEILNIPQDVYFVSVSCFGYEIQQKNATIKSDKIITLNFRFQEGESVLKVVDITGRKSITYKKDVTYSETKTATTIKPIPQDVSYVIDDKNNFLYRLNITYENSGSFRGIKEAKTCMIAPSLSFLLIYRTKINFDLVIQRIDENFDRGQLFFGYSIDTGIEDLDNTPISLVIGATNEYDITDVNYFTLSLNDNSSSSMKYNKC